MLEKDTEEVLEDKNDLEVKEISKNDSREDFKEENINVVSKNDNEEEEDGFGNFEDIENKNEPEVKEETSKNVDVDNDEFEDFDNA